MSEIENSTADNDNNVQAMPKATPSKRLTNAERARIESELLVKALGGSLEGGRRTRSSTRGSVPPSPRLDESMKRKAPATPRRTKKPKTTIAADEIDGEMHNQENNAEQTTTVISQAPANEESAVEKAAKATEIDAKPIDNIKEQQQAMEVEPNRVTDEPKQVVEVLPSNKREPIEETITIDGDSLNASSEVSNDSVSFQTQNNIVTPSESVVADTTTTVIVVEDVDPCSNNRDDEKSIEVNDDPIVTVSSTPTESVSEQNEPSQSIVEDGSVTIVELHGDNIDEDSIENISRENTLKKKVSDNGTADIVDLSSTDSDVVDITANNNNTNHSNDIVGSTNNDSNVDNLNDNDKKTVLVASNNSSIEGAVTTTSETIVEPSAATA